MFLLVHLGAIGGVFRLDSCGFALQCFALGQGRVPFLPERIHRIHMGGDDALDGGVVQLQFLEELAGQ